MNLSMGLATAALALAASAQTREAVPAPPNRGVITAEASREAPPNNKNAEDIEFLVEAMRTGLAEVRLGELAAQRSSDARARIRREAEDRSRGTSGRDRADVETTASDDPSRALR
jgi:hypothetical protein